MGCCCVFWIVSAQNIQSSTDIMPNVSARRQRYSILLLHMFLFSFWMKSICIHHLTRKSPFFAQKMNCLWMLCGKNVNPFIMITSWALPLPLNMCEKGQRAGGMPIVANFHQNLAADVHISTNLHTYGHGVHNDASFLSVQKSPEKGYGKEYF